MDISWKSIVARDIVEISIPIIEYHQNRDDLQSWLKTRVGKVSGKINVIVTLRKSLDARKSNIKYNLRLEVFTDRDFPEELKLPDFSPYKKEETVHIIGFGPAGIFAALQCLQVGMKPIVIERGQAVKERRRDVAKLNRDGEMNTAQKISYARPDIYQHHDYREFLEESLLSVPAVQESTSVMVMEAIKETLTIPIR